MSTSKKMEELEFKVELLTSIVSLPDNSSFEAFALYEGLTKEQYEEIYDLLDRTRANLKLVRSEEFEREIYRIVPSRKDDYKFAEGIVVSFYMDGKYEDVYEEFKKDSMNI